MPLPWIGQERAQRAARFGLEMKQANYNLFVMGGGQWTLDLAQRDDDPSGRHAGGAP